MKHGKWMPIDTRLACFLPKDRPYTELEATYSLQLNYDQGSNATVAGLSSSWGWSRKRVQTFLDKVGAEIVYQGNKKSRTTGGIIRPKKGTCQEHDGDMMCTCRAHVRMIKNSKLDEQRGMSRTCEEHDESMKGSTIIHTTYPYSNSYKNEEGNDGSNMGNPGQRINYDQSLDLNCSYMGMYSPSYQVSAEAGGLNGKAQPIDQRFDDEIVQGSEKREIGPWNQATETKPKGITPGNGQSGGIDLNGADMALDSPNSGNVIDGGVQVDTGQDSQVDTPKNNQNGELNADTLETSQIDQPKQAGKKKATKKNGIPYEAIIDHFNSVTGKTYRHTSKQTRALIRARWAEGFTLEDFLRVIDHMNEKWKNDPKMSQYVRPPTLFNGKFESYLQDAPATNTITSEITPEKKKRIEELKKRLEEVKKRNGEQGNTETFQASSHGERGAPEHLLYS